MNFVPVAMINAWRDTKIAETFIGIHSAKSRMKPKWVQSFKGDSTE